MQYTPDMYNPERHDQFACLTVKNPYATWIADGSKSIEVRSRPTKYRGRLLIGSSAKPVIEGMESGCTICLVTLYDCKPVSDLTLDEWKQTRIDAEQGEYATHFALMLKEPMRIVEFPMKGQLGIFRACFDKDTIIPYPTCLKLDVGVEELKKRLNIHRIERIFGGYFAKSRRMQRAAKWHLFWGLTKRAWPVWLFFSAIAFLLWYLL